MNEQSQDTNKSYNEMINNIQELTTQIFHLKTIIIALSTREASIQHTWYASRMTTSTMIKIADNLFNKDQTRKSEQQHTRIILQPIILSSSNNISIGHSKSSEPAVQFLIRITDYSETVNR